MSRYALFLSALTLAACTDTGGGDDSDSDTSDEIGFFEGERLIWTVTANCVDGGTDQWTFDFITDGLAGRIDIDAVETGSVAPQWTETHVLDINAHNPHFDTEGSPTSATTREEAAAMDPVADADDDNRPDWGASGQDFETQSAADADDLVGSWDHWNIGMPDVATTGEVTSSGASQTTLWDCSYNNHTAGAGGSIAFKATMYNDAATPASVDCIIWGFQASTSEAFQGDVDSEGDPCVCVDPDGADCAD